MNAKKLAKQVAQTVTVMIASQVVLASIDRATPHVKRLWTKLTKKGQ